MKKILILILLFSNNLQAQNFKPLVETPFFDIVSKLIELENDNFIEMHSIPGVNYNNGDYILPSDVSNYSLSTVNLLSKEGKIISSVVLPDTDSTVFWTTQLIVLNDGRFSIAGDFVNVYTHKHELFYAIINIEVTQIDLLKIIESPVNRMCSSFAQNKNGDLLFIVSDTYSKIQKYTIDGVFISELFIDNVICAQGYFLSINATYFLNDKFYFVCPDFNNRLVVVDNDFNISYDIIPPIAVLNNRKILRASTIATKFKSSLFVNIVAGYTSNNFDTIYPAILQIDTFNNVSTFFSDSSSTTSVGSFAGLASVELKYENNIYTIFSSSINPKRNYILYSLDKNCNINWKKFIDLDSSLSTDSSSISGFVYETCATKDKGFIFMVTVDDSYGNADVYYYKVDSLGNPIDFPTGLFSLNNSIKINNFLLYPNPLQDELNIETGLSGDYSLEVYDVPGKSISKYSIKNNSKIDVSNFLKGTYFYKIFDDEHKEFQKGSFLKE